MRIGDADGREKGVVLIGIGAWFLIASGVRGVVLPELPGGPAAYMLVRPSTNYYRNMTEQEPLMPVLVDQVI